MTRRYFFDLSFDGTAYHGWQIQPNGLTVQEVVQRKLSLLFGREVDVVGAGRTDAGVHARQMVAHADLDAGLDCRQLCYKLNRMLPRDICVSDFREVAEGMHARFSARSRTYHYYIHRGRNPYLRHFSLEMPYALDFAAMNEAAGRLSGTHDFAAFCKAGADVTSTKCDVTEAQWTSVPDPYGLAERWCFTISANRFLRNMVRAVVGTLVEVGRGRMSAAGIDRVMASGSRRQAGESMPARALFLWSVKY